MNNKQKILEHFNRNWQTFYEHDIEDLESKGNWFKGCCPFHNDKDSDQKSFIISKNSEQGHWECKGKCNGSGDIFDFWGKLHNVTSFPEQIEGIAKEYGIDIENSHSKQVTTSNFSKIYNYTDRDNNLLFQSCRTSNKDFLQRRPYDRKEQDRWIWGLREGWYKQNSNGDFKHTGKTDTDKRPGGITEWFDQTKPVLYRLPEVIEAVNKGERVFIVEGEKDADNLSKLGFTATTNALGSGAWENHYSKYLKGADVVVLQDYDKTGVQHRKTIIESLDGEAESRKFVDLGFEVVEKNGKDISDWIDINEGEAREKLAKLVKSTPKYGAFVSYKDIRDIVKGVEWEWRGWLPKGMLTLLVGAPGVGKSAFTLMLADNMTKKNGKWPDGHKIKDSEGKIVWVETESAHGLTVERMSDWHIQVRKFISPQVGKPLDTYYLDTDEGWDALTKTIEKVNARMLVIDSLRGAFKADETSSQTFEFMKTIADLVQRADLPCLIIHHFRKRQLKDPKSKVTLEMVRGSNALVQIPRVVLGVSRPDSYWPEKARLEQLKNNLARKPEPIGFEISDAGIEWVEAPSPPERVTKKERAKDLILDYLATGKATSKELYEVAEERDISKSTLDDARADLSKYGKIDKDREGVGGKVYWRKIS